MNIGDANIVVRARDLRETLDLTFPFLMRVGKKRYLAVAASSVLLSTLLVLALFKRWDLPWRSLLLLALPLASWTQGLFTVLAGELMFAQELAIASALKKFFRRALAYTFALALSRALIVLAGSTVLLLPLVWGRFLFLPEALLLEGASLSQAMKRAGRLAQALSGRVFELELWLVATTGFALLASESLGRGIVEYTLQLSLPTGSLFSDGGSIYALVGLLAATPITATMRFLCYIDGRARRDAWEVQIKLQRIVQLEAEGG